MPSLKFVYGQQKGCEGEEYKNVVNDLELVGKLRELMSRGETAEEHLARYHTSNNYKPISTIYQPTLSTHPINPPYQPTLSTHPNNTPYQHTLSTHPINTPYPHDTIYQCTSCTHLIYTPSTNLLPHSLHHSIIQSETKRRRDRRRPTTSRSAACKIRGSRDDRRGYGKYPRTI